MRGSDAVGKLVVTMAAAVVIGAGLLTMRQHRINLRTDMTRLHDQIDQSRKQVWDFQVRIARRTRPAKLREAIGRAGLNLQPVTPAGDDDEQPDQSAAESEEPSSAASGESSAGP